MERRDILKGAGMMAATAAAAGAANGNRLRASDDGGKRAVVDIAPPSPDAFIPAPFAGRTFIVTGSAAAWALRRQSASRVKAQMSWGWTG